ncbi:acetyl-CoA carboxylase-like [Branchiostoma floridae]|uniref:Acetyl-CoA carboxylase-like n=1 Tax=Branchiostoma floridae TaxID=7739 RepID=A0A9J7HQA9_BRAFL|nr:acetyl-CoA carboxylase-like [Branchiostoma floridae]
MNDLDLPPCQRMGAMVAFDSFSAFTRVFPEFLDLAAPPQADSPLFQEVMSMFRDSPPPSPSFTDRNQGFMEKGTSGMYGSSDSLSSLNEQVSTGGQVCYTGVLHGEGHVRHVRQQ